MTKSMNDRLPALIDMMRALGRDQAMNPSWRPSRDQLLARIDAYFAEGDPLNAPDETDRESMRLLLATYASLD